MKNIPAICVDNFYSNPDEVREFALSQDFYSPVPRTWPGSRTKELHLIDRIFFDQFCNKLFSLFFDLDSSTIDYVVNTSFQLVPPMDPDPMSPKNTGWVHFDENTIFAGVVFLTPDIELNCGTSIFNLVDENKLDLSTAKEDFFSNKHVGNYDNLISNHRSAYIETIRFNNIYNRLICFDAECAHGVNNFYSSTESRLTQVFFIEKLNSNVASPIARHRRYL